MLIWAPLSHRWCVPSTRCTTSSAAVCSSCCSGGWQVGVRARVLDWTGKFGFDFWENLDWIF